MTTSSAFVISLDFELMWGVRDHADISSYGANILGVRAAIPRLLDLFGRFNIRATWATVGFLFCESKDELLDSFPATLPSYESSKLSNYSYVDEIGYDEKADPYYYGSSLIRLISSCPGQEIGSHSFSHYYCLEPGQTVVQFAADVDAAVKVGRRRGIELTSFVFPRNQFANAHLTVLGQKGFKVFRGNERSWVYRATEGARQSKLRRACRLADNYANLTGHHVHQRPASGGVAEVPSSRFLRPYSRRLASLDGLRLKRIKSAMSAAASTGQVFHLWWHPHNFGINLEENIGFLRSILMHFAEQRDKYGMVSARMGDFA